MKVKPIKTFTVLELLEAEGISAEFQCRDGFCGACKCKMVSGDVQYLKPKLALTGENEILPCIAIPRTEIELSLTVL